MDDKYIECENCNEGMMDIMDCKDWSNECCGGCYKTVRCDECNGTGLIEIEEE